MRPSGLFWLWSGAVFNVEFLFYGTLIMTFGLTVGQAILAIIVGNVFYAFLGFASLQGPKTGTTAFMVSRAPFGQNGNRMVALFNWVTQVGFEIEGIFFVVATVILLFSRYGTNLNTSAKIVVIILAALVQMIVPLLGHATITKILRYLAYLFIVFFAVLAGFTFQRLHLSSYHVHGASLAVWTTALVLLISVGGLGWTENGNDYSRYLPRNTPGSQTFWAATLGGAIPSIILEILGVFAFTITTKTVGIAQIGVPQSFPSWFVVPFLIFAIFQLLAINTIDMYSSGVTLQALGLPIKRWGAVILDTVVCAVVTGIILFHGNFYKDFSGFLLYIVVWLAPWFGILMTDYLLRGRNYHSLSLRSSRDGLYWRNGGIHWPAIIAQVLGMVAALMWINAAFDVPSYTGPISNHFPGLNGGDFSWALGIVVAALVYWVLAGRGVRREAAAQAQIMNGV
jgi:nucleobase:cation symporter-1, NCS1 family